MSRVIVGRIFWKELRSQRSLWLGVAGLVIVVQAFLTWHTLYYQETRQLYDLRYGIFLAAWLGATFYAIGSGAASFTEETEGKTGSLLRSVPLSSGEAFLGKWGFSLGSAVLFVRGAGRGGMDLLFRRLVRRPGQRLGTAAVRSPCVGLPPRMRQPGRTNPSRRRWERISGLRLVSRSRFSLSAAVLLVISLRRRDRRHLRHGEHDRRLDRRGDRGIGSARDVLPTAFAVRLAVIAFALAVVDYWLTGIWLRQGSAGRLRWTGRWPIEWTGRWPLELTGPPKKRRIALPGPIDLLRFGEPKAVWIRGVQRLLWKELRQAWPYFAISLVAATALVLPRTQDAGFGRLAWLVGLAAPDHGRRQLSRRAKKGPPSACSRIRACRPRVRGSSSTRFGSGLRR